MGFCPYFLHAHRSDGTTSPVGLLFAAAGAGIHTTFFAWLFLRLIPGFLGDEICTPELSLFMSFGSTEETLIPLGEGEAAIAGESHGETGNFVLGEI